MVSFAGGPKTGASMVLYHNSGTAATPVWVESNEIGDLNVSDLTRSVAELKRRANKWTKALPSLFQPITVDFRLHWGLAKISYEWFRNAFLSGASVDLAIASGLIITPGTQYLRYPALVTQFPWDQGLENVVGHDVQLQLGFIEEDLGGGNAVEVNPSWWEISQAGTAVPITPPPTTTPPP